jgi:hypothetical protein
MARRKLFFSSSFSLFAIRRCFSPSVARCVVFIVKRIQKGNKREIPQLQFDYTKYWKDFFIVVCIETENFGTFLRMQIIPVIACWFRYKNKVLLLFNCRDTRIFQTIYLLFLFLCPTCLWLLIYVSINDSLFVFAKL